MAYHLITGAASGIGFQLAKNLLARGDHVYAADMNTAGLQPLRAHAASPEHLIEAALDVRDPAQWRAVFDTIAQRWPRLDTLLNVAGVLRPGYAHEALPTDTDLQIDVNTKGTIHGTQAAAQCMLRQGRGHIINIASMAGITPVPGCAVYAASKFAVRGYTLSVAQELRPRGIHVTVICPDAVATPMLGPQNRTPQAAMIFSGGAPMAPEKVVQAVLRAMRHAPLEIALPTWRAWMARMAGLAPGATGWAFGWMMRLGEKRLAKEGVRSQ